MWSSVAVVLALVSVAAAFMVGEDEEPLALSPRGAKLMGLSATALLTAAALALTGLASWRWTGEAAGLSGILGGVRVLSGWGRSDNDDGIDLERRFSSVDEPAVPAPADRMSDVWQTLPRR
jgi:hypothetical protein